MLSVWKTPAMCRKANPDFLIHKEIVGRRNLTVFLDAEFWMQEKEIPENIKEQIKEYANKNLDRLNGCFFMKQIPDEMEDLVYSVDMESETYNIVERETGRILYSILRVTGYRWSVFRVSQSGDYVLDKSGEKHWSTAVNTSICDLYV